MSWPKKILQRLGSWVVRHISRTEVPDTTSGFRAYTREAALRMTVVSEFSYTLDRSFRPARSGWRSRTSRSRRTRITRPSRLFNSIWAYLKQSGATIVRIYTMYEPLKVFSYIGAFVFLTGFAISLRFLYYYWFTYQSEGKIQSLILSAVLMIVGFQVILIGLVADVISGARKLLEDLLYRVRRMEVDRASARAGATSSPVGDAWLIRASSPSSFPA